ncbi:hypothetical protein QJS04_geneDACA001669 [Acorus gramineus]|uniref:Uncharacterized protein n=1 Tax=Acorus gramineus TaxID=55184 RepID=A0AAV9BHS7_ACOGR|nr:hypothetical protein QJS04_geneDACA001669 [Acorus gramineus]
MELLFNKGGHLCIPEDIQFQFLEDPCTLGQEHDKPHRVTATKFDPMHAYDPHIVGETLEWLSLFIPKVLLPCRPESSSWDILMNNNIELSL